MINVNLQALNPFRRSGEPEATKSASAAPPESPNLLERSKDFFVDTWESTRKAVDDAVGVGKDLVNQGAQKGREVVEETLWGEYKKDWGQHGDRYDNPADANYQTERSATIEARIASRSDAEAQALSKLSTVDQVRYKSLLTLIDADVPSKEAFQLMLINGRLPGEPALVGGGTVLANLAALADQKLAPGLDRAYLVSDLIQEVANPVIINQKDKNTCVATSSVMDLALRNPAEMVRLVAGLASETGKVKLAGGKTITREPKWNETLGERTQSIHLISAALMEMGNGVFAYDDVNDKNKALGIGLYEGLFHIGANRILSQIHDRKYDAIVVHRKNVDKVMSRLALETADGKRVPAGLAWGSGGHQIVVEGVKDGQVYYLNPHGNRERMPEAEFQQRLRSAHFY